MPSVVMLSVSIKPIKFSVIYACCNAECCLVCVL
jgi:hypothetical protein